MSDYVSRVSADLQQRYAGQPESISRPFSPGWR